MIFSTVTFRRLALILSIRRNRKSVFPLNVFSNPAIVSAAAGAFILQLGFIYLPPVGTTLFSTVSLSLSQLEICIGGAVMTLFAGELRKLF